jgi:hypothetical protein
VVVTARPLFLALSLPITVSAGMFPRAIAQGPSDGATPPAERVLNQLSAI